MEEVVIRLPLDKAEKLMDFLTKSDYADEELSELVEIVDIVEFAISTHALEEDEQPAKCYFCVGAGCVHCRW
jgi:hypothetical protein